MTVALSAHAARRCQQRGIPSAMIEKLIEMYDIDHEIGDECRALRISRAAIRARGSCRMVMQYGDRLANVTVVWSDRNSQVVTAFHGRNRHAVRRYLGRG